jgi:leader peptidase (prepilin peptidase) / N-methyltransferase
LSGLPIEWLLSPAALAILGLAIGSFLNVVAHRLPLMLERQWWGDVAHQLADSASYQRVFGAPPPKDLSVTGNTLQKASEALPRLNIAAPASRCPSCGHVIRWYENIPVVSWLVLRGRCSACKTPISMRYPFIEVLTAVLFYGVGVKVGAQPLALMWCAVVAALLALSAIDWDTTVLPDALTLPLLWAGLAAAAAGWTLPLQAALIGAAAGYFSLWSVYWLFKLTTGKEGMGYGDFKLLAALGAWLGWQAILPVVLMASVIGAVVGIAMKLTGALREGRYVPFGPFLAGGGAAVMIVGLEPFLSFIGWS